VKPPKLLTADSQRLTVLAKPLMQSLFLTLGESVNRAVPRSGVVIYILVLESPKPHRVAASVGDYSYLHSTSLGKSIAAHMSHEKLEHALVDYGMPAMTSATITTRTGLERKLAKVGEEGVAIDNEENALGIIADPSLPRTESLSPRSASRVRAFACPQTLLPSRRPRESPDKRYHCCQAGRFCLCQALTMKVQTRGPWLPSRPALLVRRCSVLARFSFAPELC